MSGANDRGDTGAQQLLPRHRYMLQKVDAAFGIYDENSTEAMFLQSGVIDKVREHDAVGLQSVLHDRLVPVETAVHEKDMASHELQLLHGLGGRFINYFVVDSRERRSRSYL